MSKKKKNVVVLSPLEDNLFKFHDSLFQVSCSNELLYNILDDLGARVLELKSTIQTQEKTITLLRELILNHSHTVSDSVVTSDAQWALKG